MQYRPVAGIHSFPRLGLGCVTFGREIDEAASFRILDHALASGITLFDTAEAYGGGQSRAGRRKALGVDDAREVSDVFHSSEIILGKWQAERGIRSQIILETKITPPLGRDRILRGIEDALARLRTDSIDLFLFHAFDRQTPLTESVASIAEAITQGTIRSYGASNFDAQQIEALSRAAREVGAPPPAILQTNYNMAMPDAEREIFSRCRAEGIAIQTFSPLAAGFLTGKYADDRNALPTGSRFHISPGHADIYFHPDKFARVARLAELAAETQIPVPQLATAWVLRNADVDNVLIGARTTAHIDAALAATHVQFDPAWHDRLFATGG